MAANGISTKKWRHSSFNCPRRIPCRPVPYAACSDTAFLGHTNEPSPVASRHHGHVNASHSDTVLGMSSASDRYSGGW